MSHISAIDIGHSASSDSKIRAVEDVARSPGTVHPQASDRNKSFLLIFFLFQNGCVLVMMFANELVNWRALTFLNIRHYQEKQGAGEEAQWLRAQAALPKDPGFSSQHPHSCS